jgi:hypothetical protein
MEALTSIDNYCELRLSQAGITREQIKFPVRFNDEPVPRIVNLFQQDKIGNLQIRYVDLDGEQVYYDQKGKLKEFFRTRFKEPKNNFKYSQAKGSPVHMYWTPNIIKKYKNKEAIKTLFITEGEIKAFVGSLHGLDIAGIGGIHNFVDKKNNTLLPELEKLITECEVRNLVLIFDADCLSVSYEEEKDLYTRPNSFYTAVKRFKELATPLNVDVYFTHILSDYTEKAKGLDDLINDQDTDIQELIIELNLLSSGNDKKYFHTLSISENSISVLRKYFAIDSVKNFYLKYSNLIQEKVFIFNGSMYQYEADDLKMLKHRDANNYLRVGCEYYKHVSRINSKGDIERTIKKWKIGEITRDYGRSFFKNLDKFDEFCNIPDNLDSYQRVVEIDNGILNYNLYEPMTHVVQEGSIENTLSFLQHFYPAESLDNPKEGDAFQIILDYLTLIYQRPLQMLPILGLVSKDQKTGKTTFLKWLKQIFMSNATILGNAEFKMEFNTHYISKLLIMIDESFIEIDKKHEKERIKNLATSHRQFYHPKGVDPTEIDFFGKLIMCSNNENNFIPLENSDVRFFIIKAKPFEKEDPDFLDKLIAEIPHFLYFLRKRKIFHPKTTRAWFSEKHLITNQFNQIVRQTRGHLERDVIDYIQEILLTHDLESFKIDGKRLHEAVNEQSKFKHSVVDIKNYLKNDRNMLPLKSQRYKIPTLYPDTNSSNELAVNWIDANGRPYEFFRADWVEEEDQVGVQEFDLSTDSDDQVKEEALELEPEIPF